MTAIASPIVLNVDDDDAQRYIKTRDLQASGFAVLEARSGAEALQLVERKEPEVVLLDVQLPDINGTEVCVYIKNKWPEVMVLMTSATFTSAEDRTFGTRFSGPTPTCCNPRSGSSWRPRSIPCCGFAGRRTICGL